MSGRGILLHLDAGEGLLVVLDLADLVALSERRLARSEIRSCGELDEPRPVGHDYPLARQVGAVLSPGKQDRVHRRAVLGVREAVHEGVGLGIKHEILDDVDGHHKEIRDAEGDDVVNVIPLDRANRAELALEVGSHE